MPVVQKLSSRSLAVGEELSVRGRNFVEGEGRTYLKFDGRFIGDDGTQRQVEFQVPAAVRKMGEQQIAKWLRFGPFTNPFTKRGQTGYFEGKIRAINSYGEDRSIQGPATKRVRLDVEPSIEIVSLQPAWAKCGLPALRGFARMPYKMKVKAIGFVPETFEFNLTTAPKKPSQGKGYVHTTKKATGPTATVEGFEFAPVPNKHRFYISSLEVRAKDKATGRWVSTALPFPIHRPIEVRYNGSLKVAEHYKPQPVTACIPGSLKNQVTYSETETEVRQQTVSIQVSRDWTKQHARSQSRNWMEGYSVARTRGREVSRSRSQTTSEQKSLRRGQTYNESRQNSFEYGTTRGESWEVSNRTSVEVGGEASIPQIASVNGSVKTELGLSKEWSQSESRTWGETVSQGRSETVENSYSLSNSVSSSRSFTNMESREESRTYNFGAEASYEKRVSKGVSEAESNTWMKSSSHETLTSYAGFVPIGRFGVFYRQTIRMVREAEMVSFNACGEAESMGRILMNEWKWAPDLAIGDSCGAKLPEPNLPEAKCHIPPCK